MASYRVSQPNGGSLTVTGEKLVVDGMGTRILNADGVPVYHNPSVSVQVVNLDEVTETTDTPEPVDVPDPAAEPETETE